MLKKIIRRSLTREFHQPVESFSTHISNLRRTWCYQKKTKRISPHKRFWLEYEHIKLRNKYMDKSLVMLQSRYRQFKLQVKFFEDADVSSSLKFYLKKKQNYQIATTRRFDSAKSLIRWLNTLHMKYVTAKVEGQIFQHFLSSY